MVAAVALAVPIELSWDPEVLAGRPEAEPATITAERAFGSRVSPNSTVMGPGVADVAICPCVREKEDRVAFGRVRADVASVTVRTEDGKAVPALVGAGAFVADLDGLSEDEADDLRYEAYDAAGTRLSP